jgi:hypothetical protein
MPRSPERFSSAPRAGGPRREVWTGAYVPLNTEAASIRPISWRFGRDGRLRDEQFSSRCSRGSSQAFPRIRRLGSLSFITMDRTSSGPFFCYCRPKGWLTVSAGERSVARNWQ